MSYASHNELGASKQRSPAWSIASLSSVAILALISCGCSTTPSVIPAQRTLQVPPNLLIECEQFDLASSGELTEILRTHTANMARAEQCRSRHGALVRVIEDYQNGDER